MKSVGKIGVTRAVPGSPKSEVVILAINLLAGLGAGSKETRQWLQDLKAAAQHNERLIAQATKQLATLADLEIREAALSELAEREHKVEAKPAEAKAALAANEIKAREVAEIERREAAVAERERIIAEAEAVLVRKREHLQKALATLG